MRAMFFHSSPLAKNVLGLLMLVIGAQASLAQQRAPVASPPQNAALAPSSSSLAAARALVIASGISRSFAVVIPQYMKQIEESLTQTRPEIAKDLGAVLAQLKTEFERQADDMIDIAAQIYAKYLSESELKAAADFFESSVGKKYVETQPALLGEMVSAMQNWQAKISADMMTRVRSEMRKKGHEI